MEAIGIQLFEWPLVNPKVPRFFVPVSLHTHTHMRGRPAPAKYQNHPTSGTYAIFASVGNADAASRSSRDLAPLQTETRVCV